MKNPTTLKRLQSASNHIKNNRFNICRIVHYIALHRIVRLFRKLSGFHHSNFVLRYCIGIIEYWRNFTHSFGNCRIYRITGRFTKAHY